MYKLMQKENKSRTITNSFVQKKEKHQYDKGNLLEIVMEGKKMQGTLLNQLNAMQRVKIDVALTETESQKDGICNFRKAKPRCITTKVAPSPGSLAIVAGGGFWGYTEDESITPTLNVTRDAKDHLWRAKLVQLLGNYSLQATLLPGVTEVTGPGGNTNAANWRAQVDDLENLGDTPTNAWYMVKAVEEHEKIHANSLLPALIDVSDKIEKKFNGLNVPMAAQSKQTALSQIKGQAAYVNAVQDARDLWDAKYVEYIDRDHMNRTPDAEHKIVDPMIKRIKGIAKARQW